MFLYFSWPATRSFQWSNISARTELNSVPLAIRLSTVVRNRGENGFLELFWVTQCDFSSSFAWKRDYLKLPFFNRHQNLKNYCNNFKEKQWHIETFLGKKHFVWKVRILAPIVFSDACVFPAIFTTLECIIFIGKNFHVWNLIKFKKDKNHFGSFSCFIFIQ